MVPIEEETARLKAGSGGRRLLLHPELSQLRQFLKGEKKDKLSAKGKGGERGWSLFFLRYSNTYNMKSNKMEGNLAGVCWLQLTLSRSLQYIKKQIKE